MFQHVENQGGTSKIPRAPCIEALQTYHERYTMADLFISDEAEEDLDNIAETLPDTAGFLDALFEVLIDEPHIVEVLNRPQLHHAHQPAIEIKKFGEMQRRGKNVFIIKVWEEDGTLSDYRCLYAHDPQRDRYHVLMIVNREVSYDPNDLCFVELNRRYDALGLRKF